jgi:hypothetical protein
MEVKITLERKLMENIYAEDSDMGASIILKWVLW